MKTENKQPLYKMLNERRSNGDWAICHQTKTGIFVASNEYRTDATGAKYIFEVKQSLANGGVGLQDVANAQYTALAVNNLHILAEALEGILHFEGALRFVMTKELESPEAFIKTLDEAKKALNRII